MSRLLFRWPRTIAFATVSLGAAVIVYQVAGLVLVGAVRQRTYAMQPPPE